jgi:hypothetical protein
VYSRDHVNKLQTNQQLQQHIRHSTPISIGGMQPPTNIPMGSSIPASTFLSYLSTSSSSGSSTPSSINLSPFSLSSLSSSSSSDSFLTPRELR